MLTRANELRSIVNTLEPVLEPTPEHANRAAMLNAIDGHLKIAEHAAASGPWRKLRTWLNGAAVERASSNLDAVEVHLLRIAPCSYVCGQLPSLAVKAQEHLPREDQRRRRIEEIAFGDKAKTCDLTSEDRDLIVAVARASYSAGRREIMRIRSFRNVLLTTAAVLLVASATLATLGALQPSSLPLCFMPTIEAAAVTTTLATEQPTAGAQIPLDTTAQAGDVVGERARTFVVCPTRRVELLPRSDQDSAEGASQPGRQDGSVARPANVNPAPDEDDAIAYTVRSIDVGLVTFVGLIAAGLSAAISLRQVRATSTPYSLPVALALLKLPTGALTAVLGLLLMRGEFVPGLSALDSPGQIIAWAAILGYAQQLVTRLVDQRARAILAVSGPATKTREE